MSLANVQAFTETTDAASVEPEQELIEQAKRDPEVFATLYQRFRPFLLTYVYRRTGDVHATEDLVADVFMIVLGSIRGYRHRGVPFRFWLLRIATNTVNRWARRQRRRATATLDEAGHHAEAVSSTRGSDDSEFVQRALLTLAPRYQAVLSLHHLEGLSVRQTAAVIGCREGTVRSRLARARDALREKLSNRR